MYMVVNGISDRVKKDLDVQNNLYGEQIVTDLRPVAGKSAANLVNYLKTLLIVN